MQAYIPFLLFSTEQDAKDFIKNGNCPKTPHGQSYRIVKSKVARYGESLSNIPKAFKHIDIRKLPVSGKNRLENIKNIDLKQLNNTISDRLYRSCVDISKVKSSCFSQLLDKMSEVLRDFTGMGDFFTIAPEEISFWYKTSPTIKSITDKKNKHITAIQYQSPLSLELKVDLPLKNKKYFLESYRFKSGLEDSMCISVLPWNDSCMHVVIDLADCLLQDPLELKLSKPISLECDYHNYRHVMQTAGTAIIKEINKNNLQQELKEQSMQKIIKTIASFLAEFFSDYIERFYN